MNNKENRDQICLRYNNDLIEFDFSNILTMCVADFLKKLLLQINSTGEVHVLLSRNVGTYNIHRYTQFTNKPERTVNSLMIITRRHSCAK